MPQNNKESRLVRSSKFLIRTSSDENDLRTSKFIGHIPDDLLDSFLKSTAPQKLVFDNINFARELFDKIFNSASFSAVDLQALHITNCNFLDRKKLDTKAVTHQLATFLKNLNINKVVLRNLKHVDMLVLVKELRNKVSSLEYSCVNVTNNRDSKTQAVKSYTVKHYGFLAHQEYEILSKRLSLLLNSPIHLHFEDLELANKHIFTLLEKHPALNTMTEITFDSKAKEQSLAFEPQFLKSCKKLKVIRLKNCDVATAMQAIKSIRNLSHLKRVVIQNDRYSKGEVESLLEALASCASAPKVEINGQLAIRHTSSNTITVDHTGEHAFSFSGELTKKDIAFVTRQYEEIIAQFGLPLDITFRFDDVKMDKLILRELLAVVGNARRLNVYFANMTCRADYFEVMQEFLESRHTLQRFSMQRCHVVGGVKTKQKVARGLENLLSQNEPLKEVTLTQNSGLLLNSIRSLKAKHDNCVFEVQACDLIESESRTICQLIGDIKHNDATALIRQLHDMDTTKIELFCHKPMMAPMEAEALYAILKDHEVVESTTQRIESLTHSTPRESGEESPREAFGAKSTQNVFKRISSVVRGKSGQSSEALTLVVDESDPLDHDILYSTSSSVSEDSDDWEDPAWVKEEESPSDKKSHKKRTSALAIPLATMHEKKESRKTMDSVFTSSGGCESGDSPPNSPKKMLRDTARMDEVGRLLASS